MLFRISVISLERFDEQMSLGINTMHFFFHFYIAQQCSFYNNCFLHIAALIKCINNDHLPNNFKSFKQTFVNDCNSFFVVNDHDIIHYNLTRNRI